MPPNEDNSHYEKILATGEVKCIDDEIPFEIPESWEWCRLGILVDFSKSTSVKADKISGDSWLLDLEDIEKDTGKVLVKKRMHSINAISDKHSFKNGNVLYSKLRPYLNKVVIADEDGYCTSEILCFDFGQIYNSYAQVYLMSPYFVEYAMKDAYGVKMPRLGSKQGNNALMPIPPIKEQYRIITKLSEIHLLIDQYSNAQIKLEKLNFEIKVHLKKSILQEAIQGKLVPQDPNDEPATVLLERVREEKKKLVTSAKLKKKDLTDSTIFKGDDNKYYEKCGIKVTCIDNEVPFTIPESWQWARLGELITTKTGLAYSKPNLEIKSNKMVRVLRGGNITNGSWQMKADDVMISSEFVKPELYLRKGYFITPAVTSWENMGKTALVRESYEDVVVGGFVLMMCPFYIDGIFEEYLNHFFQSTLFQQYCRSITNKSGQAFYNLSRNKLLQLLVPIPPVKEQQRIYHKLNDALASIMSR